MSDRAEEIRVLHVDDDSEFAEVVETFLEREDDRFRVQTVTTARDGLERVSEVQFDCVISDYDMPGQDGIELLEAVRDEHPDLPFILYTGKGSEEIASEAISSGVTDYLQKGTGTGQYAVLANRITNAVEKFRAQRALSERTRRLETLISNLPGMVYRCRNEPTWPMETVEGEVEELTGYGADELETDEVVWGQDVLHPDDRESMWKAVQESLADDGTFEVTYRIITSDGATKWMWERGRGVYSEVDELVALEGFITDITDRKERERELRQKSARLDALFKNSPDLINIHDMDGTIIDPNPRLCEETGYDADELVDMKVWDIDQAIDPDEAYTLWEGMDVGDRRRLEGVYQRRDGSTFPVEVHLRRLRLEGKDRFIVIARDITERRERERQLEETNTLLSTLIETLPVGVIAEDASRNVLAVNERLFELFEMPGEVVGADCEQIAQEVSDMFAQPERFVERIDELIAEHESTTDEELTLADGRTFERSYRPIDLPEGGGHLWLYRDVSDRVERQRERETTIEFLQGLYDVATDMSLDTNEKITRLLELGPEKLELPSGYLTRIEVRDETAGTGTQRVIEASGDHELLQPGNSCPLSDSYCRKTITADGVVAIRDAFAAGWGGDPAYERFGLGCYIGTAITIDDELYGTVFFASETPREEPFTDAERTFVRLTSRLVSYELERDHARQELEQQNERLEEFASVVSHDLRNPLNVAEGRLELGREECDNDHLESVARAHERMNVLIDDLLTLAREGDEAVDPEPVSLADCSEDCWQAVETADATLVTDTDRILDADRSQLRQLLENLFRNALEHGGQDVTVTVGPLENGFYVEDDGPGIPEDERDEVFEAGYSTSTQGTGFGLSIIEQVVNVHGWEIRATEGSEGGARFEITGVE